MAPTAWQNDIWSFPLDVWLLPAECSFTLAVTVVAGGNYHLHVANVAEACTYLAAVSAQVGVAQRRQPDISYEATCYSTLAVCFVLALLSAVVEQRALGLAVVVSEDRCRSVTLMSPLVTRGTAFT